MTHFNNQPGRAGCGARLPRRPVAPSDHMAIDLDLAAIYAQDAAFPPVAEADRPVALVIEDDPTTRARIADILEGAGWSVRQARDGEQGLLMAGEHLPEVVLLDLALPGLSGLEVLRELKCPGSHRPPRVVVVSFFAMLLNYSDLRLVDGVVQKPFAAADLLAQVALAPALA